MMNHDSLASKATEELLSDEEQRVARELEQLSLFEAGQLGDYFRQSALEILAFRTGRPLEYVVKMTETKETAAPLLVELAQREHKHDAQGRQLPDNPIENILRSTTLTIEQKVRYLHKLRYMDPNILFKMSPLKEGKLSSNIFEHLDDYAYFGVMTESVAFSLAFRLLTGEKIEAKDRLVTWLEKDGRAYYTRLLNYVIQNQDVIKKDAASTLRMSYALHNIIAMADLSMTRECFAALDSARWDYGVLHHIYIERFETSKNEDDYDAAWRMLRNKQYGFKVIEKLMLKSSKVLETFLRWLVSEVCHKTIERFLLNGMENTDVDEAMRLHLYWSITKLYIISTLKEKQDKKTDLSESIMQYLLHGIGGASGFSIASEQDFWKHVRELLSTKDIFSDVMREMLYHLCIAGEKEWSATVLHSIVQSLEKDQKHSEVKSIRGIFLENYPETEPAKLHQINVMLSIGIKPLQVVEWAAHHGPNKQIFTYLMLPKNNMQFDMSDPRVSSALMELITEPNKKGKGKESAQPPVDNSIQHFRDEFYANAASRCTLAALEKEPSLLAHVLRDRLRLVSSNSTAHRAISDDALTDFMVGGAVDLPTLLAIYPLLDETLLAKMVVQSKFKNMLEKQLKMAIYSKLDVDAKKAAYAYAVKANGLTVFFKSSDMHPMIMNWIEIGCMEIQDALDHAVSSDQAKMLPALLQRLNPTEQCKFFERIGEHKVLSHAMLSAVLKEIESKKRDNLALNGDAWVAFAEKLNLKEILSLVKHASPALLSALSKSLKIKEKVKAGSNMKTFKALNDVEKRLFLRLVLSDEGQLDTMLRDPSVDEMVLLGIQEGMVDPFLIFKRLNAMTMIKPGFKEACIEKMSFASLLKVFDEVNAKGPVPLVSLVLDRIKSLGMLSALAQYQVSGLDLAIFIYKSQQYTKPEGKKVLQACAEKMESEEAQHMFDYLKRENFLASYLHLDAKYKEKDDFIPQIIGKVKKTDKGQVSPPRSTSSRSPSEEGGNMSVVSFSRAEGFLLSNTVALPHGIEKPPTGLKQ